MIVMNVRNGHEALPEGIKLLYTKGQRRESRNGPVMVMDEPVATVFENPSERIISYPERDYNSFFVLFESLWMLQGRNDIKSVGRYAKNMLNYSDDGITQHAAYGHRWRKQFGFDQLSIIAHRLTKNPNDRRSVLQMWDSRLDLKLDDHLRDVPCNVTSTFQIGNDGRLHLVVFCRSHDLIWGDLYANAGHFSFLLNYMSNWIGIPAGTYTSISVNYHAYLETLEPLKDLQWGPSKYRLNEITSLPLTTELGPEAIAQFDAHASELLMHADTSFQLPRTEASFRDDPFFDIAYRMLYAHHIFKTKAAPEKYTEALAALGQDLSVDWIRSGREWLERRYSAWQSKMENPNG